MDRVLQEIKEKFEYLGQPFINNNGKILLNPGDIERYEARKKNSIFELVEEGRITLENNSFILQITDKCLKSELEVEVALS